MDRPPAIIANFLAGLTSLAREASIGRGLFLALPYLASPADKISACCVVVGMVAVVFVESEGSCAAFFAASSSDEILCLLALLLFVDMDSWVISPSNMESVCCVPSVRNAPLLFVGMLRTSHRLIYSTYHTVLIWPSKLRLVDFTTTQERVLCRRGRSTFYCFIISHDIDSMGNCPGNRVGFNFLTSGHNQDVVRATM